MKSGRTGLLCQFEHEEIPYVALGSGPVHRAAHTVSDGETSAHVVKVLCFQAIHALHHKSVKLGELSW